MSAPLIAALPVQPRICDLGTHTLAYADFGKGSPVILLHGGLMDHSSWGNQTPLAARFRLVMPSTRGHGESTGGNMPATYAAFADDTLALMDHLDLARAHLVGFSDGGCAALDLALRAPERLRSLTVIGTPYNRPSYEDGVLEAMAQMQPEDLEVARPVVREMVASLRRGMSNADWLSYWPRIIHGLWLREPNHALASFATLNVPTLILHGEHEHSVRLSASRALATTIPDARLEIIPNAGHSAAQDAPETVNSLLSEFLTICDARA